MLVLVKLLMVMMVLSVSLSGEATLKHEFINLPDNISEEVVRLLKESTSDTSWLKSLVNNLDFQELDRKVKVVLG